MDDYNEDDHNDTFFRSSKNSVEVGKDPMLSHNMYAAPESPQYVQDIHSAGISSLVSSQNLKYSLCDNNLLDSHSDVEHNQVAGNDLLKIHQYDSLDILPSHSLLASPHRTNNDLLNSDNDSLVSDIDMVA
jgi:hypothetical protein